LLDEILQLYVEESITARDIIARGYDEKTVRWVARRVDLNEWNANKPPPASKSPASLRPRPPHALAQRFVD